MVVTDFATAELVKVAANSFLATKISFINAMAEVCEAAGADVVLLADAIGHDERIGRSFLNAGLGFGGGCLPKDIRAFMARAGELGADQALTFLREVDAINMRRRSRMVDLARGARRLVRRAPDRRPRRGLQARQRRHPRLAGPQRRRPAPAPGRRRRRHRPRRPSTTRGGCGPSSPTPPRREEACERVDVVLLLTEWPEYVELDPEELGTVVRQRNVLDGRNALDVRRWQAAGWNYRALGRPHV